MLVVATAATLPPRVLPVIWKIEGGAVGVVHQNENGTQDLARTQVSTIWGPVSGALGIFSAAETRTRLIEGPCFNIAAAGWRSTRRGYLQDRRTDSLAASDRRLPFPHTGAERRLCGAGGEYGAAAVRGKMSQA